MNTKRNIRLVGQTFLSSDNDFIYPLSNIYPKNSASWIIWLSFQNLPLFSSYHRVRVRKLLREDSVTASRFHASDWHQIWHEITFPINAVVESRRLKFHGQIVVHDTLCGRRKRQRRRLNFPFGKHGLTRSTIKINAIKNSASIAPTTLRNYSSGIR